MFLIGEGLSEFIHYISLSRYKPTIKRKKQRQEQAYLFIVFRRNMGKPWISHGTHVSTTIYLFFREKYQNLFKIFPKICKGDAHLYIY